MMCFYVADNAYFFAKNNLDEGLKEKLWTLHKNTNECTENYFCM